MTKLRQKKGRRPAEKAVKPGPGAKELYNWTLRKRRGGDLDGPS